MSLFYMVNMYDMDMRAIPSLTAATSEATTQHVSDICAFEFCVLTICTSLLRLDDCSFACTLRFSFLLEWLLEVWCCTI